jgi:2-oxoglutarate dehydrogenase complex dehydrogenase (E1) component-like enzyme
MEGRAPGDVKYHMGFSSDVQTPGGIVHLALGFNPSHLEIVNPVVVRLGAGPPGARRRQASATRCCRADPRRRRLRRPGRGLWKLLQMPRRPAATRVGGTVHIVDQQPASASPPAIRWTRARRSTAPTSAKMVQAPIFHVNGDDPEAVAVRHPAGAELPHDLQAGRGDRHGLLPPARPQRGRRAGGHPADDVQEDPRSTRPRERCMPAAGRAKA